MAKIGNFGQSVVFRVSDNQVLTFNSFNRTVKSKWNEHNSILTNPASEYVGRELDSISLTIVLCASLGVKPQTIIKKIENLCKNGTVQYLVIGNRKVGTGKYYIESVSETWDEILTHGELFQATLNLTFKEYGK